MARARASRLPIASARRCCGSTGSSARLGTDGAALVHDVLVLGLTMDQIGARRAVRTQRWTDYFSRRFRECLDRLALIYGFATETGPQRAERRG